MFGVHERTAIDFIQTAEPVPLGLRFAASESSPRSRNSAPQSRWRFDFENARLGGRVILEGVMAVEMVARDVQHHRDMRMEGHDGFELKAADLQHDPADVGGAIGEGNRRSADVATDQVAVPPAATMSPGATSLWSCRSIP